MFKKIDIALDLVTQELILMLSESLPQLSINWWQKYVSDKLTTNQQRFMKHKEAKLNSLDLSATIRVFTSSFVDISKARRLSPECKNFAFQVLDVRNRVAHRSPTSTNIDDTYRDLDTIVRFLNLLKADSTAIESAQKIKKEALELLSLTDYPTTLHEKSLFNKEKSDNYQSKLIKAENNISSNKQLKKREALSLLKLKTNILVKSSQITYSNINKRTGHWWLEPSKNAFTKERGIILNDHHKNIFYVFLIPANTFQPANNFFYIRPDNGSSSIHIDPSDTKNFKDIHPSGHKRVSFISYLIQSVKY